MSVDLALDGAVAVITLNRPERKNAFTREQYDAFAAHLDDIAGRDDVRVAIVTGAGGSFSSGQDLKEMAELATAVAGSSAPADPSGTGTGFTVLLDALQRFPKPLLAAVEGVAVGIGMTLLPYCDIVVVAESARMRVPFSELGVPPEAASSALLADLVGWQRAAEILLTSRWVSSDQAVDYGLALGFPANSLIAGILMIQFIGFPATLVFGWLGDRISPLRFREARRPVAGQARETRNSVNQQVPGRRGRG